MPTRWKVTACLIFGAFSFGIRPAGGEPLSGKIAFSSTRTGNQEIFVMDPDGTHVRRLTDFKKFRPTDPWKKGLTYNGRPRWSPDGRLVAFVSNSNMQDGYRIYTVTADGSSYRLLLETKGTVTRLSWSPDGKWMLFNQGDDQIRLLDVRRRRARDVRVLPGSMPAEDSPDWSRDGKRIAFTGTMHATLGDWQTYVADIGDKLTFSNGKRLTNMPEGAGGPTWSPDGTKIAFILGHFLDQFTTWVMDQDGSNAQPVSPVGNIRGLGWSPDGARLVLSLAPPGHAEEENIYVMNVDGSGPSAITSDSAANQDPDWSFPRPRR